jgi:raffinose/stachyose/melibiose transport system permease protein
MTTESQSVVLGSLTSGHPHKKKRRKKLQISGLPWILPAFIFVVGLIYYSIGFTVQLSTLDWDGISPDKTSVGFGNFVQLFHDPIFGETIWHTILFFVVTFVVQVLLGFVLAAILQTRVHLAALHKVLIFIPTILAPATMAPVFRLFFSPQGLLTTILNGIGLGKLAYPWLANPNTAFMVIMLISVWQWTGLYFILYNAAMTQIDPEILEAARVDGAGNIRTLFSIVWPNCRGTTISLAMLGLIGAFKTFDVPYLVTTGGPNHATEFLGTYIYTQGIRQAHLGYASALSIILLILAICGAILMSKANTED